MWQTRKLSLSVNLDLFLFSKRVKRASSAEIEEKKNVLASATKKCHDNTVYTIFSLQILSYFESFHINPSALCALFRGARDLISSGYVNLSPICARNRVDIALNANGARFNFEEAKICPISNSKSCYIPVWNEYCHEA